MESNPDAFFRYEVFTAMDAVRKAMAAYLDADPEDVTLVPNASEGVNAVLRSLKVPLGMKILYLNTAYYMVKATASYLSAFADEQVQTAAPIAFLSLGCIARVFDVHSMFLERMPALYRCSW